MDIFSTFQYRRFRIDGQSGWQSSSIAGVKNFSVGSINRPSIDSIDPAGISHSRSIRSALSTSSTSDNRSLDGLDISHTLSDGTVAYSDCPCTSYDGASCSSLNGAIYAFHNDAPIESCFICSSTAIASIRAASIFLKFKEKINSSMSP